MDWTVQKTQRAGSPVTPVSWLGGPGGRRNIGRGALRRPLHLVGIQFRWRAHVHQGEALAGLWMFRSSSRAGQRLGSCEGVGLRGGCGPGLSQRTWAGSWWRTDAQWRRWNRSQKGDVSGVTSSALVLTSHRQRWVLGLLSSCLDSFSWNIQNTPASYFCKFICWSASMITNTVNSRVGLHPFPQCFRVESSTRSFCDGSTLGLWPLVSLFGICLDFVFGVNSVLSLERISNRGVLQEQFQKCSGWAGPSFFRLLNISQVEGANFWFWNFLLWGLIQRSGSCLLHFTKESLSSFHLLCILEFLVTEYSVIKDPFVHYILNVQWCF